VYYFSDIAQQLVEHHQTTQSSVFQIQKPNKSTSKNYLSPSTIGSLINRFAARRHKTDMPVRAMSWNESSNGYRERNVSATPPPPHTTESKPTPTRGLKSSDTKPKDLESSQQGITSMPQSLRRSFKWRSIFATPNPKNPKELHHASSANNVTNKTMSYTPTANTDIPNKPLIKNLGHSQAKTKPSPSNDLTKKCSFSSTCSGNSGIVPLETVFENEPTDEPSTSIQRESSALVRVKLREFNNNSSSKLSDGSIKSEAPAIAPRPFSVIGSSESSAHDEHSQMKYRLQMQQIYRIRVEDSNKLDAFISKRLPATPSSHQYSEVTRLERNSTETGLPYLNIEPRIRPHATTDQDFPKFEELCPTVAMNSLNDDGLNEMTAFVNIRPRRRRPRDSAGRSTVAVTASTLKRRKLSQFRHYNVNTNTATLGRRKSMNTQHLKASMNSEFLLSNLQHRTTEAILSRKESTKILAGPLLAKRKAKSYSTSSLRQIFYGGSDNRSLLKKAKVAAMEVSMENR
jgi:hypothetical protein